MKKGFFYYAGWKIFPAGLLLFFLCSCFVSDKNILPAVSDFQAEKYMGKWYEAARTPNPFEKGLSHVTAFYRLQKDDSILVVNKGILPDGKSKSIKGKAYLNGKKGEGRLKVTFFPPFYGEYKIVKLDPHYQYSIVVSGKKYLWILSRKKTLSRKEKNEIMAFLEKHSLPLKDLLWEKINEK